MFDRSLGAIFNDCIDRLAAGETIEDCLRAYPQHARTLRPLLEVGELVNRAQAVGSEALQAERRVRERLLRELEGTPRDFDGLLVMLPRRQNRQWVRLIAIWLTVFLCLVSSGASGAWLASELGLFDNDGSEGQEDIPQTPSATGTPSATVTVTPTPTASITTSATPSASPSSAPTVTPSQTPTATQQSTVGGGAAQGQTTPTGQANTSPDNLPTALPGLVDATLANPVTLQPPSITPPDIPNPRPTLMQSPTRTPPPTRTLPPAPTLPAWVIQTMTALPPIMPPAALQTMTAMPLPTHPVFPTPLPPVVNTPPVTYPPPPPPHPTGVPPLPTFPPMPTFPPLPTFAPFPSQPPLPCPPVCS